MSQEDKNYFVVIDTIGRAENLTQTNWHDVLKRVGLHVMSAGSTSPLADKLLRNGAVVVEKSLHTLGWNYIKDHDEALGKASAAVDAKYKAPWESGT